MNEDAVANPYESTSAPFVGRQMAFARLDQYLKNPSGDHAMIFVGQRKAGKTAFLRQFERVFEEVFIGVYIPLQPITGEGDLWRTVVVHALGVLSRRDFTMNRLPPMLPELPDEAMRDWLLETWLPEAQALIRPFRQLILLLDDGQRLIEATTSGALPKSVFAHWQEVMKRYPQIRLVMTIDAQHETSMSMMSPILKLEEVVRLTYLSNAESTALLREPVRHFYTLSDQIVEEIYRASGGQPQLLQRAGYHIFRRWQAYSGITPEDVKELMPVIYEESLGELEAIWQELAPNEKLILNTISQLVYENPLGAINSAAIERWMIETDYPMDTTTIHAALRGLEYREIIGNTASGLMIVTGFLQKWLLENTVSHRRNATAIKEKERLPGRLSLILIALLILILVIGVVLIISAPQPAGSGEPEPTVTLATR
jgi:hypothetical protein